MPNTAEIISFVRAWTIIIKVDIEKKATGSTNVSEEGGEFLCKEWVFGPVRLMG